MDDCNSNNSRYFATLGIIIIIIIHISLRFFIPRASLFTANKQTTGGTLISNTGQGTGGYTGNLGGSVPINPGNPGFPPFLLTSGPSSNIMSSLVDSNNIPEQIYNTTPKNRENSSDFWFYYL